MSSFGEQKLYPSVAKQFVINVFKTGVLAEVKRVEDEFAEVIPLVDPAVVVEPEVVVDPEVVEDPEFVVDPEVVEDPEVVVDPELVDDPDVVVEVVELGDMVPLPAELEDTSGKRKRSSALP